MPDLYPTFEVPDIYMEGEQQTIKYGKSWAFDFELGDYITDGSGRTITLDGHQAWAQWCLKAVMTERFAHIIYSQNYGAEMKDAMRQPTRAAVESAVERTITETLLADVRTKTVRDFTFRWDGENLYTECWVFPTIGDPIRIGRRITLPK